MGGLGIGIVSTLLEPDASRALESDEFEEVFDDDAIGIELEDVSDTDQLTPVTGKLFYRKTLALPHERMATAKRRKARMNPKHGRY